MYQKCIDLIADVIEFLYSAKENEEFQMDEIDDNITKLEDMNEWLKDLWAGKVEDSEEEEFDETENDLLDN